MKKVAQGLRNNLYPEDIQGWTHWCDKFTILDNILDANPEVTLVGGLNLAGKKIRQWMKLKRPFICFNRPSLGGHSDAFNAGARRVSVNSYACTTLGTMTHSRWHTVMLPQHPWKVQQVQRVLVAPPLKSLMIWTGKSGEEWATEQKSFFESQGAEVRIRLKTMSKGRVGRYVSLWDDLDWADLVVSYSSAITCEAFWYGKKAISLGVCPTWVAAKRTLDDWRNPTEPAGRALWHEHIAWTQFTKDEWASGDAQEMIYQYQGWPTEVTALDNSFSL